MKVVMRLAWEIYNKTGTRTFSQALKDAWVCIRDVDLPWGNGCSINGEKSARWIVRKKKVNKNKISIIRCRGKK